MNAIKWYIATICIVGIYSVALSADLRTPIPATAGWVCIARTPILQKAYSGSGASKADARAAALKACGETTPFGCYVERCDNVPN